MSDLTLKIRHVTNKPVSVGFSILWSE